MSTLTTQQPSKSIPSSCLEGMPLRKKSKHRFGHPDLSLNKVIGNVNDSTITKKPALKKQKCIKNIGLSVGIGAAKCIFLSQVAVLVEKNGVIPGFNVSTIMTQMCVTVRKTDNFLIAASFLPAIEEFIFRHGIQEILLRRIPRDIIKLIIPGKETMLDSKVAKVARIVITSALFSYVHLQNKGTYPDSYCNCQVVSSFIGGIVYGILKESKFGLLGSTLAHLTNNVIASISLFSYC